RYYTAGPPADWPQRFISAYASAHPWEDWAECWAHYIHMTDALETAESWGLRLHNAMPGPAVVRPVAAPADDAPLRARVIEQWLPVSQFVNEMNRSLGVPDGYPFALADAALEKLDFVHRVVSAATS